MTLQPATVDELRRVIVEHPTVRLRGANSKPALVGTDGPVVDLTSLAGIIDHAPEECTFTALAGTPVSAISRQLATYEQYLPFDPPFAEAGATLGGTVSAGINGPCRYRYGGVRDFLIGARIVDGKGRLVRSGGKVVKNAAGFLLHQAMVGSCGRFGALAEMTFKVFPRPPAAATVVAPTVDVTAALDTMASLQRERLELDALDIDGGGRLVVRLAGAVAAMESRIDLVRGLLGRGAEVLRGAADESQWRVAREFTWAPASALLARVPVTPTRIPLLDEALSRARAVRRYSVAGNVAFVAWTGDPEALSALLSGQRLLGQVLRGDARRVLIGVESANEFGRRVASVMDPDNRFGGRR
jgi:glycolate dehydrogenase FAD-binding subunit